MGLRRLWLLILVLVTILAIGVNTLILTSLTDRYFSDYLKESYDTHVEQILEYTKNVLSAEEINYNQLAIRLESHLTDPIISIKLYNQVGELLIEVETDYANTSEFSGMMGNMMNRRNDNISVEVHQFDIISEGELVGTMNITNHSVSENSFVARKFKGTLLLNSLLSIAFALFIVVFVGIFISKKMTRALKDTESLASDIQLGKTASYKSSGIKEVNAIRESLRELNTRLKIKQLTRKSLLDQMVHQTRTPLTILQTHLEGIEDGIIDVNQKELTTCQNQISDITHIISNMSKLIDAGNEKEQLIIETFDLTTLLRQIEQGLSAQFKLKNIAFHVDTSKNLSITTDRYKLSQGIYNILTNAYKYTKENGTVTVSYRLLDNSLEIKIQDTGIGIEEKDLKSIFDAYYRGGHDNHQKGDGIGLFIVNKNIKSIGGYVDVKSKVNVGSEFVIHIPMDLK